MTKLLSLSEFKNQLHNLRPSIEFIALHLEISEDYALAVFDVSRRSFSNIDDGWYIFSDAIYDILGEKKYLRAIVSLETLDNFEVYIKWNLVGKFGLFELLKPITSEELKMYGSTIMKGASQKNQISVVRFLKIRMKSAFFEMNPIHIACSCSSDIIFSYLCTFGNLILDEDYRGALEAYRQGGYKNPKLMSLLTRNKKYYDKKTVQKYWKMVSRFDSQQTIKCLLKTGLVDINTEKGFVNNYDFFHKTGYSYDSVHISAPLLASAVDNFDVNLVRFLLKREDINPNYVMTIYCTDANYDTGGWSKGPDYKLSILELAIWHLKSAQGSKVENKTKEILNLLLKHHKIKVSTECQKELDQKNIKY